MTGENVDNQAEYDAHQAELEAMHQAYEEADQAEYVAYMKELDREEQERETDTANTVNGPIPVDAYAQAPDLNAEAATAYQLLAELDPEHRPAFSPRASATEWREALLRVAAVTDRRWSARPTIDRGLAADRAAFRLMDFDRRHPAEIVDDFAPWSLQWDRSDGKRAYVRHAYDAWLNSPVTEDCNNCQGETCRACNRATPVPAADGPATRATKNQHAETATVRCAQYDVHSNVDDAERTACGAPASDRGEKPGATTRVHRFLAADPRVTVCGRTHGPDGPFVLTVSDLYTVLAGNATKAQEAVVRAFADEFDSLRDTDHPDDNDHIATAPGGAVLHNGDVRTLLDDLDPAREDPSDVLPLLLTWPNTTTRHRIRRDQLPYLLAYVEELVTENA
ncbi:hypothetical protein ACFVUY_38070 [Kitasatospora sp. NPDC058063]|uniref:hypothetical protein n=1 Tax=unclassified Kitasatospora TaxID=2633591 RepID=UPI0036DC7A0F